MQGIVSESVAELLAVVFYGGVASVLALFGALAERAGIHDLLVGHATIGLWEVAMGALLLYAGVSVVREFVLPGLRGRSA
jgi:hypothetical protein